MLNHPKSLVGNGNFQLNWGLDIEQHSTGPSLLHISANGSAGYTGAARYKAINDNLFQTSE